LDHAVDSDEPFEDGFPDGTSLEVDLDRHELIRLLDRALALLPAETAQMLIEHYIQESSHAEIAEKMRLNPGTVAMRLQRGKLTLQKFLRTRFSAEASSFGLVDTEGPHWEPTNIWCPWCAETRLLGRYRKGEAFALRCPICHPEPDSIMVGLDLTKPCHADLLGNTITYKPAYARLLSAFAPLYRQALKSQPAPCLACGQPLQVHTERDDKTDQFTRITLHCPVCGWVSNKTLSGLVLASPEAQRFWREYPRIKIQPPQVLEAQGLPALLTRLQSVSDASELVVISRQDTFEPIEVHSNIKL
jgi:hypothetical protein